MKTIAVIAGSAGLIAVAFALYVYFTFCGGYAHAFC
jgi:hypothetical protein